MLRPKAFWTPRYVRDRLLLARSQHRHPDLPWWPRQVIRALEDMLVTSDRVLEWGSGRSTVWLSARVEAVHSIEHDAPWFEQVGADLTRKGLDAEMVHLRSTDPGGEPARSPYVRAIDEFAEHRFTVFIVDGEHRGICALAALDAVPPGGILIVDDAHWFLDRPTGSPHSRVGKGPADKGWAAFEGRVEGWRCVWCSDGVTDTAVWIRPPGSAGAGLRGGA